MFVAPSACSSSRSTGTPAPRPDFITQEQIRQNRFTNAYDVVAALHANWLQPRGTDSFNTPSQVQVYYDNSRLGGIETLRTLTTQSIVYIRYYNGTEATTRWGLDHGAGAIVVSSRPQDTP
jgi:hypothetical protein